MCWYRALFQIGVQIGKQADDSVFLGWGVGVNGVLCFSLGSRVRGNDVAGVLR